MKLVNIEQDQTTDWEDYIRKKAEYALRSRNKLLLYEVHGMQEMAYAARVIDKDSYYRLNDLIVAHGMNNPQWCRENYGGVPK